MPARDKVTYGSGTSEALGLDWDVMQVVYSREDGGVMRIAHSFTIARDARGAIMRKANSLPERWEVVKDPDDYRAFQACFAERNRLAAEKAANPKGE